MAHHRKAPEGHLARKISTALRAIGKLHYSGDALVLDEAAQRALGAYLSAAGFAGGRNRVDKCLNRVQLARATDLLAAQHALGQLPVKTS